MEVKIIQDPEPDDGILVCMQAKPLFFDDNQVGECDECAAPIQFRPTAKQYTKKVCLTCALPHVIKQGDVRVTETAAKEVSDYFKKHSN